MHQQAADSDLYEVFDVLEVLQQNIESGNRKIPHKAGGRGMVGRVKFHSSPEGQVRILVWNILALCIASIKDVLIITPPFPSVASSSSPPFLQLPPSLYLLSPSVCLILPFSLLFTLLYHFLSSPLPNVFLSGLRWNRKCWFNNSWSEFWAVRWFSQLRVQHRRCSSSLPSFFLQRWMKSNHIVWCINEF